jgi:hypothetical protein
MTLNKLVGSAAEAVADAASGAMDLLTCPPD